MTKIKYIRFDRFGIIVFPDNMEIMHSDVRDAMRRSLPQHALGKPISAGFVSFERFEGGKPYCHGKSESMDLASRGAEDTVLLHTQWGLTDPPKPRLTSGATPTTTEKL